jgi:hypothetical protein
MEDKVGARSLGETKSAKWIASAPFDLFFIANIAWPLLLIPGVSTGNDTAVDFWQVYYLTLPHRWITLFLVVADPDRRSDRTWLLVSMALMSAAVVTGAYFGSGAFLYSKKSGGGNSWLERWGLRCFLFYVIVRTSSSMLWKLESDTLASTIANLLDWTVLVLPCALVATNIFGLHRERLPKFIYLVSVVSLYSFYLLASHFQLSSFILCLATAAALFHAVEYLAIVSHYANRRREVGSGGLMRMMSEHWMLVLTVFVICLGTIGVWASSPSRGYETIWQGANLWAAFTHYALDGVIWKLRRPETAMALGAT